MQTNLNCALYMKKSFLLSLTFLSALLQGEESSSKEKKKAHSPTEELKLYLHEPEGTLVYIESKKGAVIEEGSLRIQADYLRYYLRDGDESKKTIVAEGNLAFDNGHHLILADKLIYNLSENQGEAINVRMSVGDWFVGGKKLKLHADRTMTLYQAFLTPSENLHYSYSLSSKKVTITDETLITAEGIKFEIESIPLLYLPYLKANLTPSEDSPISYELNWVSGQGPQLVFRYRIYSSDTSSIFARADLRSSRGFGGAIETNTKTDKIQFNTKSYLAHDTFYRDDDPNAKITRYRLLGNLKGGEIQDPFYLQINYDRLNDKNLPDEFVGGDFEYHSPQNTYLNFRATQKKGVFGTNVTPRINSFQGFKQELPTLFYHFFPLPLGPVQFTQSFKGQFLDYVSAKRIEAVIEDFNSYRLSSTTHLQSCFNLGPVLFVPDAEFEAIHYTSSTNAGGLTQCVFSYNLQTDIPLFRKYSSFVHEFTPFIHYNGVSKPTALPGKPLIFSIEDGWNRLNLLNFGFSQQWHWFTPAMRYVDVKFFAQSFLGSTPFATAIPYLKLEFESLFEILRFHFQGRWNHEEQEIDFILSELGWTITPKIAFSILYAYRSPFYYRRVDVDDYFFDVTNPLSSIIGTPLSDKRNLLRTKLQFPLSPTWKIQMQTMHSWDRQEEPSFTEIKVDALTYLTTKWQGRFTYAHTVRGDIVNAAFELAY